MIQYTTYTSVMWKLKNFQVCKQVFTQTLEMDFTVN